MLSMQCSLDMKLLIKYLRNIPFLEHRTYISSAGKQLDKFVRNDTLWKIHSIYRTALMMAEEHRDDDAHSIMIKAMNHTLKHTHPCRPQNNTRSNFMQHNLQHNPLQHNPLQNKAFLDTSLTAHFGRIRFN